MSTWTVLGQDRLIAALDKAIRQNQLAHAHLLVGPPQVGKTTLALQLAQAANCLENEKPCGHCVQCHRIEKGLHADVQVIVPVPDERTGRLRTEIGIDQVRDLQRMAALKPYEGRCRVFILQGVERLSAEAANALLKTLEEPPPQVLLLLLTAHEERILPTIRSRCQRLELRPLREQPLMAILTTGHGVGQEDAVLLARLSGGRLGWALAAAADPKVLGERQQRLEQILEVMGGGLERRFQYAQELASQFTRDRAIVHETLALWLAWWRDVLMLKQQTPDLMVNLDWRDRLKTIAQGVQTAQVTAVIRELLATLERLEQNANPRIALDVLMLVLPMSQATAATPPMA